MSYTCDLVFTRVDTTPVDPQTGWGTATLIYSTAYTGHLVCELTGPSPRTFTLLTGYGYISNLPQGAYHFRLYPEDYPDCVVSGDFSVSQPTPGCTDPDADNYDPTATQDDGSCLYSRHVDLVAALPALAPLGVPLWVSLAAGTTGAVGAPATCLLDLSALGSVVNVLVRVDGYLFTSGPLTVPNRFLDAASLLAALLAQPTLAANYLLTSPAAGQVLLTARQPGLPGTPTVTTSNAARVALTLTPGVAALWSQRRPRWGCYLEIWAGCGSQYGGTLSKVGAQLAQRIELPYREGNSYRFDLAPALSAFTGHDPPAVDGSSPERLVSYFLRFGELYADSPTGLQHVATTYESPIAWGLEAMQVPPAVGALLPLTTRPAYQVSPGARLPFGVLAGAGADVRLLLRYRLATSRTVTDVLFPHALGLGQVTRTALRLPSVNGLLSGELRVSDSAGTVGPLLATLTFRAGGQALSFVNRDGSQDTVQLFGSQEPTGKRTAATYANQAGPQGLSAEYQGTQRLYSGPLDFATWDWLRQELGASPQAWLETDAGPVPMLLADVATEADTTRGEYSLSVDLQPPPVRGLSN